MARGLYVGIFADTRQLDKGLAAAATATKTFTREMAVSSETLARTRVAGSVKTTEALKLEVAEYHRLAAAAQKGSAEQVAAANLATQAERRLAASMGVVTHEANTLARSSSHAQRELSRAARGALSGSGIFRGFGRSLAFASGGFLAFEGVTKFLTDSINAAREAAVAQRSLAAQMKASGESFDAHRAQIEKVSLSYGKFGFENDAVIQSLTVLERGTGSINKAIRVQGLTADIARAKNISLAAAATVVAKVFGGQETALRRAVPGLSKHAHGWDLIRLAQAKMAGQAAANTTASEKFAATLRNTEEIIGGALLPVLNRYLASLGNWLQRMNESGKLQKDVAKASHDIAIAFNLAKTALQPLLDGFRLFAKAVGGTDNALKILVGTFAAFKGLKIIAGLAETAAGLGKVAAEAGGASGKVLLLRANLLRLVANPYTIAIVLTAIGADIVANKIKDLQKQMLDAQSATFKPGAGVETALVPRLAAEIKARKAGGQASKTILAELRKELGGSLKADDLIAEAFSFSSGSDPKLQARIRKAVAARADEAKKTAADELKKQKPPTVQQRNTWFDALISRQLGRVQDITSVTGQIGRLTQIAALIGKRINVTKDITRKLNLEDTQLGVFRQIKAARLQLQQDAIDALSLNVDRAGLTKTLNDDIAALQAVNAGLEQQQKLYGYTIDREKQIIGNLATIASLRQQQADKIKEQRKAAADRRAAARQAQLDRADFAVERAQSTKSYADDLVAEKKRVQIIKDQIRTAGLTLEREKELFAAQQAIVQTRRDRLQAERDAREKAATLRETRQFRALGLGPGGSELIPPAAALRKRLGRFEDTISGTFFDTNKMQAQFAHVARVLSGSLGKVSKDVRAQIKQMLDDWRKAFDEGAKKKPKFETFYSGGHLVHYLSGQQTTIGQAFGLPDLTSRTGGAGNYWRDIQRLGVAGLPFPPTATGGTARGMVGHVTINGGLHLHGVQNVKQLEEELTRRGQQRPQTRRGPV